MFGYVLNGVVQWIIQQGVEFTINGITYPGNWLQTTDAGEQQAIGMFPVMYGPQANDQYYWVSPLPAVFENNQIVINYTDTPKDLVTVQSTSVNTVNNQAYTILLPSDWMVVRQIEDGTQVPANWNAWRQTIRNEAANATATITAATNVDQVAAVFPVAWTPDPDQPVQGA